MSKYNKGTLRENVTKFDNRFNHFSHDKQEDSDDDTLCEYDGCWTPYSPSGLKMYEDVMGRRNRLHPACYQDGLRKAEYLKSDEFELDE